MMKKMFAVYDSKVEAYMVPMFFRSKGEALRVFMDAANDEKSALSQHSEDYTLFEVAEWDELTGTIKPLEAKRALGCAKEFKRDIPKATVAAGLEKD